MNVILDNDIYARNIKDFAQFSVVWSELETNLYKQQRVIEQVIADRHPIADLRDVESRFQQIETLHILTISDGEFVESLLAEIDRLNHLLLQHSQQVATAFYGEEKADNWDLLVELLQGMQTQYTLLETCLAVFRNMNTASQKKWADRMPAILITYAEKTNMLEAPTAERDRTMIADLVTHELMPVFEDIREELVHHRGER